ncbi:NAD(P)H-dependent oxidoreductase [Luteolibacter luteus]|uniref:NAD(P)H-dependent oxidoreductase n=1 Tax=Luteolibacter luteus TaxID=2728835 RepID=A0A858RQ74_9BACT|nr:NAD(P)H-dependent oxidoreductase [Luteolibacter luteus]QJE98280.1 NAD(P)H-dependent oxidoreductase [Luteolibacter luteus]
MHALIVVSHPNPDSLTHSIARELAAGLVGSDPLHSFEIADLTAEGFKPGFTQADLDYFREKIPAPADIAAEQERIDRADTLVLVYPIYWWSLPGLLKGWIDRVFTNGWAYGTGADGKVGKKLRHLKVHLLAVGGADSGTFERHGYFTAMQTQIDHGIFDYCGAQVMTSEFLLDSETQDPQIHLQTARKIGEALFLPDVVAAES